MKEKEISENYPVNLTWIQKRKLNILNKFAKRKLKKTLQKELNPKDRQKLENAIWKLTELYEIDDNAGQPITKNWLKNQSTKELTTLLQDILENLEQNT